MIDRPLDTATLDLAAKYYAGLFVADQRPYNRNFVMKEFYNFFYKDEFNYLVSGVKKHLGPEPLADFERRLSELAPRTDEVFHALLEEKRPVGYVAKGA